MKLIAEDAQLASLVLPLAEQRSLLLPNNCVAEVVRSGLASAISSVVTLGTLLWREKEIPVISVEGLLDGELPEGFQFQQAAVVAGLVAPERLPYFAIALNRMPQLCQLSDGELGVIDGPVDSAVIHSRVEVDGQELLIPNWQHLEGRVLDELFGPGSWSQ